VKQAVIVSLLGLFARHAGLDPASRDPQKKLDSGFRRNDDFLRKTQFMG
jgi:hypothetical protein